MSTRSALFLCALTLGAQAPPRAAIYSPTPDERRQIEQRAAELDAALGPVRDKVSDDLLVDAEVYLKAARWILRFNEFYSRAYVAQTLTILDTGLERAHQLAAGQPGWVRRTGSLSRAYRSRVDGSVQPYAVTVPQNYSGSSLAWMEVVLHGRGATLNEVSFLYAHDHAKPAPAGHDFIRLEVFGRGNNAYRWAGETDVFEAIESVRKRYQIDPSRIALRGFSMGGAGAWHLGLHYPDRWAAVEAGAGFVETERYAKVPNPPPYVHIYDAADYAPNAFNVPTLGYGGQDDPQLAASVSIRNALEKQGYEFQQDGLNFFNEDLRALFLVGLKTQHRWHPESKKKADAFVMRHQSGGILQQPEAVFVTYTERYNQCFGVTIDQLEHQYQRAEVDYSMPEHAVQVETTNVARLTLRGEPPTNTFQIDGQSFPMSPSATFERVRGKWRPAAASGALRKSHGLQGPIDDAFMDAFLCVKPADAGPRTPAGDFALRQLDRFAREFPRWMRGDVRLKTDRELTAADARTYHIVAFGTPSTSPVVARALKAAPIRWTNEAISIGSRKFDAATHLLSMIYPNPANPKRYIVINSGHTFHEADFQGTNALLYPRVGDWAVTDVRTGKVAAEGIFDRNWR